MQPTSSVDANPTADPHLPDGRCDGVLDSHTRRCGAGGVPPGVRLLVVAQQAVHPADSPNCSTGTKPAADTRFRSSKTGRTRETPPPARCPFLVTGRDSSNPAHQRGTSTSRHAHPPPPNRWIRVEAAPAPIEPPPPNRGDAARQVTRWAALVAGATGCTANLLLATFYAGRATGVDQPGAFGWAGPPTTSSAQCRPRRGADGPRTARPPRTLGRIADGST